MIFYLIVISLLHCNNVQILKNKYSRVTSPLGLIRHYTNLKFMYEWLLHIYR